MKALITGASTGIGLELAKLFAADGYDVILVGRNRETLQHVADDLTSRHNITATVMAQDLSDPAGAATIHRQLQASGTQIDVLVNNAGFGHAGPFVDLDLGRQLGMIQVNITSLVALTHLLLPDLMHSGSGGILNVASTAAFLPGPYMAVYYATKAFVFSFSEALANEFGASNLKISTLCPGPTRTEFQKRAKLGNAPIFKSGLFKMATAEQVARAGYEGFKKGRRIIVPGLLNKLSVFSTRVMPRTLATKIAGGLNRSK